MDNTVFDDGQNIIPNKASNYMHDYGKLVRVSLAQVRWSRIATTCKNGMSALKTGKFYRNRPMGFICRKIRTTIAMVWSDMRMAGQSNMRMAEIPLAYLPIRSIISMKTFALSLYRTQNHWISIVSGMASRQSCIMNRRLFHTDQRKFICHQKNLRNIQEHIFPARFI